MASVKTTAAQRASRRDAAWRMHTQEGKTQMQIADELGYNQATISRDLAWCSQNVIEDLKEHVRQVKVEQVEQLRHMVSEMFAQWETSKGTKKVVTRVQRGEKIVDEETGVTLQEPHITTTQHVTQLMGDITYIREARAAMADIRKILGADAPLLVAQKVDLAGPPITVKEIVVELPEDLFPSVEDGE